MTKENKTLDKMIELKIMTRNHGGLGMPENSSDDKGVKFTEKWQKLIFDALNRSAKTWHNNGRKGDLKTFDEIEKLVTSQFSFLDPMEEIEISYYITAISKEQILKANGLK